MVVEDDEQLNEVLCYNLKKAGYQVTSMLDGDAAVDAINEEKPDLLLLDVMLPGRSGWDICQHLSEREDLGSMAVVFFTAKSAREDYDRARKYPNFAGYFVKPYATLDVMRHISKLLDKPAA
jgi:DNA-binding response OmpR family regulator